MALPDRPVSHASIESVWGQGIHDWTFAPRGTILQSSATTSCGTGFTQIRLDQIIQDPGGWMDASPLPGVAVAPTGSEGIYIAITRIQSINGTAGAQTRAALAVNGTTLTVGSGVNNGGVAIQFSMADIVTVTAGDIFTVSAQKDSGSNPDVSVGSFAMIRIGDSVGA